MNFLINTEFVKSIDGWKNGALTEGYGNFFKIMQSGKLIALAYNSEAFNKSQKPSSPTTCSVSAGLREITR